MQKAWKRRGKAQIPAFGDWEYVNQLPITQYFESARQAGLLRYPSSSSSSGECDLHRRRAAVAVPPPAAAPDLCAAYCKKPRTAVSVPPPMKGRGRERKQCHVGREGRKQGGGKKVFDVTVTGPPKNHRRHPAVTEQERNYPNDVVPVPVSQPRIPRRTPKAVDEDLYQIPPHLLRASRRKSKLGFISRCWKLPCGL
ncbi:hypothetical protein Nepgr_014925 [Nepenthes gracilis]|uniref:Uncharacterized protein n=1 Tax=Nepenthes gracilis TaxID=150966 RepID=A0AAD3SM10_NEPGR|nr:hypothetical protein Nepgr_014925 [Nepenthes gracilis]